MITTYFACNAEKFCKGLACSGYEVLERGWIYKECPRPQGEDRIGMWRRL